MNQTNSARGSDSAGVGPSHCPPGNREIDWQSAAGQGRQHPVLEPRVQSRRLQLRSRCAAGWISLAAMARMSQDRPSRLFKSE